jgi:hypothetical protein
MKNMAFNVNSHINLMLLPPPPPQNVKISNEKLSLKEFLRKVLFPSKKKTPHQNHADLYRRQPDVVRLGLGRVF